MAESGPELLATEHAETLAYVFMGSAVSGGIDPWRLPTGEQASGLYRHEFPNGPYVLKVHEKLAIVMPAGDERRWPSSGVPRQNSWGNHDDFAIHALLDGKWRRFGLDSMEHRMRDVQALAAALGVPVVITRLIAMCDMY